MKRDLWKMTLLTLVSTSLFAACGSSPGSSDGEKAGTITPPKVQEPITLNYYTNVNATLMDLEIALIQKKFPHITIKPTFAVAKENTLPNQLVAAGYTPDLINYSIGSLWDFQESGLLSDLTANLKETRFDTSRFLPNVLASVQAYSDKGEMIFLPYNLSTNVLYYNKDIFDRFGVAYPTDGMTWSDVNTLAKRLTREEGGVKYKGFQFQNQNLTWKNQLLQPLVDPVTHKTLVNGAGWKRWMETMGGLYLIPGNEYGGSFVNDFTVAMYSGPNALTSLTASEKAGKIKWDLVSLPSFPGELGKGTQMIAPFYAIPPTSKYKKEAFQIIDYMLSDEMQVSKARSGVVSIIKSDTAIKEFGKDLEGVEGKNLAAFFKDTVGTPFRTTPYDDIAKTILYTEVLPNYYKGTSDINTIFRNAEEKINQKIQDAVKK